MNLHRATRNRFVRFLVVGVFNTAFGYGLFALFLYGGLHYAWSLLLATVIGVVFNFFTTGRLVFASRAGHPLWRFIVVYVVVYGVNVAGVRLLTAMGLQAYVAGAAMMFPVAMLSYLLNKKFVFCHG